jgi:hypothetical protein
MKKLIVVLAGMLVGGLAQADSLAGVDRMVCAAMQVQICVEEDTCYEASADELGVPDFVVIDMKKKSISTTKSSDESRSTTFTSVQKTSGLIFLQGIENGRAFSFIIEEISGRMTVAVARDGAAVNVFGACTSTDL